MDVVEVLERLMVEFEGRLPLDVISRVVLGCRQDLDSAAEEALPELVERLARQRLLDQLAGQSSQFPPSPGGGRVPSRRSQPRAGDAADDSR